MNKKITALFTALLMLLNINAFAFTDVDSSTKEGNAINELSGLGILNGFSDNSFRPDDTLTRAQFAKIAVHMLGGEKEAETRSTRAVFSDVPINHWANGYINYIAEKEIINGYPDGRFGTEDTITYAQALTILIRLLGYSGEDVGYRWPEGYVTKAQALGITEGISFGAYDNITRKNAAYVIYNTLRADKKAGSGVNLLSSAKIEYAIIYADSLIDASLSEGNIATTKGVFKLAEGANIESSAYGKMGVLFLDSQSRVTAFVPENETVQEVTLLGATLNGNKKVELTYSQDGVTRTLSLGANASLYYEGKESTLEKSVSELEAGREARLIYSENGSFERIYLKESSLEGPVTIKTGYSQIYSSFKIVNKNTLSVVRNGITSRAEDIDTYDVTYYMPGNNTLYAYTDKISGTYEDAYPLKTNVTSVIIAGKEYPLSTQTAINKMNNSQGAFDFGDRVTLLLGRNGEVVDVVDLAASGSLDLVVLTKSYAQISEETDTKGKSIHYITVVLPDGGEVTYEADKDYSDYVGDVVRVEYKDNIAKLSIVKNNSIYGEFDPNVPSLNGHWISANCTILELVKNTSSGATVKKIELRDIAVQSLTKNQVIHAQTTGSMKDITFLYVTDVTKSDAAFGVVTEVEGTTYTVLVDNRKTTIRTALKLSGGSAVEIEESPDGQIPKSLIAVESAPQIDGYTVGRIRVNGENYLVSDYVKIYGGRMAAEFESMSMAEIVNNENVQQVTLYSDRPISQGGIIRVIVVKTRK